MHILVSHHIAIGCLLVMAALAIFMFATFRRNFFIYYFLSNLFLNFELALNYDSFVDVLALRPSEVSFIKWVGIHLAICFGTHYLRDLFELKITNPLYGTILKVTGYSHLMMAICCLAFKQEVILDLSAILAFLSMATAAFVAIRIAKKGFTSALYISGGVVLLAGALALEVYTGYRPLEAAAPLPLILLSLIVFGSLILSFSNIHEILQHIQELQESRIEAAHASRLATIGELATSVAHEIKNPIAAIQYANELQSSFLEDPIKHGEKLKKLNTTVSTTIGQIQTILSSLDAVSRRAELDRPEPVAAKELVKHAYELCQHRIKHNQVDFSTSGDEGDILVRCREGQICQVLLNLINNSLDALEAVDHRWINIELKVNAKNLTIAVEDNGSGIPKDIVKDIHKSFFTTKERGKGTGLGLNICRRIVQQHRGTLEYIPSCKHTRFELTLPDAQLTTRSR